MTCHYPVINQRGNVAMASEITITGNTIRLVAEGDITQHEWMTLLARHDLAGRAIHVLDYQVSDYGAGDTVIHQWLMQLANTDTTLRVAP